MAFLGLPYDDSLKCQKIRTDVLVVSRTRMKDGFVCIGGFDMIHRCNIRLLSCDGGNQPEDAPFRVGQIWRIVYVRKNNISYPHVEDVRVENGGSYVRSMGGGDLKDYIFKNCHVLCGSPEYLFGGCLHLPHGRASYIDESCIPGYSVCFWVPEADLSLTLNGLKYRFNDSKYKSLYKYVGHASAVRTIPGGSLVRMSLARWWDKNGSDSKKCYLQLSGWF